MIRIAIADDHALVRRGFRRTLSAEDIEVVFEAEDGANLVEWLESGGKIDVAIVDIEMPDLNGIEVTQEIAKDVAVLIVTAHDQMDVVTSALQAGASGVMSKRSDPDALQSAVRLIAKGGFYLDEYVRSAATEAISKAQEHSQLTTREHEVLGFISQGLTNREIAAEIGCAPGTVRAHLARILMKLKVKNRKEAAAFVAKRSLD